MAIRHDLTPQLRKAATARVAEAERLGDTFIGVKHTLRGLLAVDDAAAPAIVRDLGCDLDEVRAAVEAIPDERPHGADPDRLPMTKEVDRAVLRANKEASTLGSPFVGTEHLLLGLLAKPFGRIGRANAVAETLAKAFGLTYRKVRRAIKARDAEAA